MSNFETPGGAGFVVKVSEAGGLIVAELHEYAGDIRTTIIRQTLDTLDQEIIKKLVALGWTPPARAQQRQPAEA